MAPGRPDGGAHAGTRLRAPVRPSRPGDNAGMLLAGDLGGTNTRLGLFSGTAPRPTCVARRDYRTLDFPGAPALVTRFLHDCGVEPRAIDAACLGVAGPVREGTARLTNVPWEVSASELARLLGVQRVRLLNDVVVMAHGLTALEAGEVVTLQPGRPAPQGHVALVTVGTGFGACLLHRVGGRYVPAPSEAGHADFPARTDREIRVLQALRARFGPVDVERVVSGQGLANLAGVFHGDAACPAMPPGIGADAVPKHVTANATAGRCSACGEAFDVFVDALAAAAGNFALQVLAMGGLYIGGGIPPRIVDALRRPSFLDTFRAKPPLDDVLAAVPVHVVCEPDAGLIGAAIAALP